MDEASFDKTNDPLGLRNLGRIINEAKPDREGLRRVLEAYQSVLASYDALADRYQVMKQSAHQLAEEVAWLRDQCDDFAMERNEFQDKLAAKSEGRVSRWLKRRREEGR